MGKIPRILGYSLLGLTALVAGLACFVLVRSNAALKKTYTITPRAVPIPTDAAALARGRHIAETRGCADCHGPDYGGAKIVEDGAMGRIHGVNLTRGQGSRIASFKDEDWVRAIRHGVGPDGRGLFLMPSGEYAFLSDQDLGEVIAYLKAVPAVDREKVTLALGPVSRALLAFSPAKFIGAEVIDHARAGPPAVAKGPTVEYGRYMAAACMGCHGPNFSGGKIDVGPPDWPEAANLTPHPAGRLARWSEADFIKAIRTGQRPDGSRINPVMPLAFGGMDEIELQALWAYFRTLPPVEQGAR